MKFLIILALALASVSAIDLRHAKNNVVAPEKENEGRITNGQDAATAQFPHQVGLELHYPGDKESWCGGSLLSPEWVLTAAHCGTGLKFFHLYLGSTIRTVAEITYTLYPEDFIAHPEYDRKNIRNDIALIKIPPVKYSDNIQPITLPAISDSYSLYTGEKVITSGWGLTVEDELAERLQWAKMEIIPDSVCKGLYGNLYAPSNICLPTHDYVSTCIGDSGGALYLESSKIQVGLASYRADRNCLDRQPVVFTRVTSYLDWIKENTGISY